MAITRDHPAVIDQIFVENSKVFTHTHTHTPAFDAAVKFKSFEYYRQSRQRGTISDGDVALEKVSKVLHIVLTAPSRLSFVVFLIF